MTLPVEIIQKGANWAAIGSIATAGAVIIALFATIFPIWRDFLHRRKLANVIRQRLVNSLAALGAIFVVRMRGPKLDTKDDEREHYNQIRTLLAQIHLLSGEEANAIGDIFLELTNYITLGSPTSEIAGLEHAISDAGHLIDRHRKTGKRKR